MLSKYRFLLFSFLAACALVMTCQVIARNAQAEQSRPYGRFNAPQIIALTEPLCRQIAPEIAAPRLSATPGDKAGLADGTGRTWHVECDDAAGNHVAEFRWDADTGELLYVCHRLLPLQGAPRRRMNQREAVQVAREWLTALEVGGQARHWRFVAAERVKRETWVLYWQAEGRRAFVMLNARSGEVIQIALRRLPTPSSRSLPLSAAKGLQ
jgi:hypothetical protein